MQADGTNLEQITSDESNNWFPHPSPDGRFLVFLSYAGDVSGHPANQDVTLRLLRLGEDEETAPIGLPQPSPWKCWHGYSAVRERLTFPAGPRTAAKSPS